MPLATKTNLKLEILLATMHRDSLDFLVKLFPNGNYLDYNILIVNQTTDKYTLKSAHKNIRVINSYKNGLANSRNLAIDNAIGDVCLIADDDIKFKKDFKNTILEAHKKHKKSTIVTFMLENFEGDLFKNYPKVTQHNLESIKEVNSVVISFKRKLLKTDLKFNTNFGLGAEFKTADEYIFMRDALQQNINSVFHPKVILSHPNYSSGQDNGNDILVYARAALYYKYSGFLGYLKLCKYLYLIEKDGYIKKSDFYKKFKMGLKGISKYKTLVKLGEEH